MKATKIDEIFTFDLTLYLVNIKSTVKSLSISVAFIENMNFSNINLWVGSLFQKQLTGQQNILRATLLYEKIPQV